MKHFDDFIGDFVDDGAPVVEEAVDEAEVAARIARYRSGLIASLFSVREISTTAPPQTPCSHWGNKWRGRQDATVVGPAGQTGVTRDAAGQPTTVPFIQAPTLPEGFTWSRNNPLQPGRAESTRRQQEALVDAYVALAERYMAGHSRADIAEAFDDSATLRAKKKTSALRALGLSAADIKAAVDGAHVVVDEHGEAYPFSVDEVRRMPGVVVEESPASHVDEWRRRIKKKLRALRTDACSSDSSPPPSSSSAASSPAPSPSASSSSSPVELHPDLKRAAKFIRKAERIARCGWAGATKVATHDSCVVVGKSGDLLVTHEHCDVRDCATCGRRMVRKTKDRLRPLLKREAKATDFLLVTGTKRGLVDLSFADAYDAVDDGLVKLRRSRWFKRTFRAGLAGLEATYSTPSSRAAKADVSESKARELSSDVQRFGALAVDDDAFGASVAAAHGFTQAGIERARKKLEKLRREQERLRDPTKDGSWWHVHVHMVLLPRVPVKTHAQRVALQAEFNRQWAACLGLAETECSTDVEKPREALDEVVKYAVKGNDIVAMPTEKLAEYLDHKEGRRFIRTFGDWYGRSDFADALDEGKVKEAAAVDETLAPHALEAYAGHTLDPRDEGRAVPWSRIVWRSDDAAVAAAMQWAALGWEAKAKGLAVRTMVRATSSAMPPVPSHGKTRVFRMRSSGDT